MVRVMDQNQPGTKQEKPRSGVFLWVFIVVNIILAIVFDLRFFYG